MELFQQLECASNAIARIAYNVYGYTVILSYLILSYLILSYLILSYFILSYLIRSDLISDTEDHSENAKVVWPCDGKGRMACAKMNCTCTSFPDETEKKTENQMERIV